MTTITMTQSFRLLTKPGIVMGNAITAAGGFALASKAGIDFWNLFNTLVGLSAIIASAGIFNNYIDRAGDTKMERTKNRALAFQQVTHRNALIFAAFLAIAGTALLAFAINPLSSSIAIFGLFVYVVLYSFSKYRTVHATLIGSIAGSVPPVVGYTAAAGALDLGAGLLFLTIALWQMPHFYAIAIYRLEDYAKASIPVLPIVKGIAAAKIQMLLYIAGFIIVSSLLTWLRYAGAVHLIATLALGAGWLALGFRGLRCENDQKWARQMFIFSLFVVTALSLTIAFV